MSKFNEGWINIGEAINVYPINEVDKAEFHIDWAKKPVYQGTAYAYPGKTAFVQINDIIENELDNHIEYNSLDVMGIGRFSLDFGVRFQNEERQIVRVYNSWEKPSSAILNDNIKNVFDVRQYAFVTFFCGLDNFMLYENGKAVSIALSAGGYYFRPSGMKCGEERLYEVKLGEEVLGSVKYKFCETEKKYALYYINKFGGWDSLLVEGNSLKRDIIESSVYESINGKIKYRNAISSEWVCYTDDMNDGSKMDNLFESTEVLLHNLESNKIIPVIIKNTSCEYKTYPNQGNKRFYYEINLEEAKQKIRK